MAEAGTVNVRFTITNAEMVRQALVNLGKDGLAALKQFDASAQPANKTMLALSDVVELVRGRASGLAGAGGSVAMTLTRWGPAGLAAGAALGVVALSFKNAVDSANAFGQEATRIEDVARSIGLSVTQLMALNDQGAKFAIVEEKLSTGLQRFAAQMEEFARGQGALFELIQRIDPTLALEMAAARDLATQLDLLGRAYVKAGADREAALSRTAFGKTGFDIGLLIQEVRRSGGIAAITEEFRRSGDALDEAMIRRVKVLKTEIDDMAGDARRNLESIYSEKFLSIQRDTTERWLEFTRAAKEFSLSDDLRRWLDSLSSSAPEWLSRLSWLSNLPLVLPALQAFLSEAQKGPKVTVRPRLSFDPGALGDLDFALGATSVAGAPGKPKLSAEALYNIERQRLQLLGSAITPTEALRLRTLELAAAQEKYGVSQEIVSRALAAYSLAQLQTAAAIRERIGLEVSWAARVAELNDLRAKGFIRSEEEMQAALRFTRREFEEAQRTFEVRRSETPALTRWRQDALDLNASLDRLSVEGLDSAGRSLLDFQMGTKRAGEAWSAFVLDFGRGVLDMLNKRLILGPVARGVEGIIGSILSGLGGGGSGSSSPAGFAEGGIMTPHGPLRLRRYSRGGVATRPQVSIFGEGDDPEAYVPLPGDRRIPVRLTGARGPTAISVNPEIRVHVENKSGDAIRVSQQRAPGGFDIGILVELVDQHMAQKQSDGSGHHARVLKNEFGLQRQY